MSGHRALQHQPAAASPTYEWLKRERARQACRGSLAPRARGSGHRRAGGRGGVAVSSDARGARQRRCSTSCSTPSSRNSSPDLPQVIFAALLELRTPSRPAAMPEGDALHSARWRRLPVRSSARCPRRRARTCAWPGDRRGEGRRRAERFRASMRSASTCSCASREASRSAAISADERALAARPCAGASAVASPAPCCAAASGR